MRRARPLPDLDPLMTAVTHTVNRRREGAGETGVNEGHTNVVEEGGRVDKNG